MHKNCPHCGVKFEREAGFFLGSIYFNYGLTALIVAIAYPILMFSKAVGESKLLIGCLAFTLLFPMWFHRYARALWLGFDQFMDPRDRTDAIGAPPLESAALESAALESAAPSEKPANAQPKASHALDVDTQPERSAVDVDTTLESQQRNSAGKRESQKSRPGG